MGRSTYTRLCFSNIPITMLFQVVAENISLPEGPVGLTNIGFGGSNSHTILYPNEKSKRLSNEPTIPRLVVVSGRTKEATENILDAAEVNQSDADFLGLLDKIHEEEAYKHPYRGFALLHNSSTYVILFRKF